MNDLFGIYVHWPFCASKCPYCDFNSHVAETIDHERWAAAYLKELDHHAALIKGRKVSSIFFGGGTPSLMNPETVQKIIFHIQKNWKVSNDIEITLEANPTSIESEKFKAFKAAGVNRISVGVQSLHDDALKFLGRQHSAKEALAALEIAGDVFDRVNFDLIYARPEQTLKEWRDELKEALNYTNGHLSVYQLTIEPNTAFQTWHARGDFQMPQEDLAADFYDLTQDILEGAGLPAYEVSNHAATDQESRHNLIYWTYGDYAGIGPGAHGRLTLEGKKLATRGHRAPEIWLESVESKGSGLHPVEDISKDQQMTEAVMMGLRLREGINIESYKNDLDQNKIKALEDEGLLILDGHVLRTTPEGLKKLNSVLSFLLI